MLLTVEPKRQRKEGHSGAHTKQRTVCANRKGKFRVARLLVSNTEYNISRVRAILRKSKGQMVKIKMMTCCLGASLAVSVSVT